MKVIIQRVKKASCIVDNQTISSINQGMMILVGFTHHDNEETVQKMAQKIVSLRIFEDLEHKMNLDIKQISGSILSISQFTLYASTKKGNRPSFIDAMEPAMANELYLKFNQELEKTHNIPTFSGQFGSNMELEIICDGPVTIEMEY